MKKRLYKVKNKILVQCNEEELLEHEILIKQDTSKISLKERINGKIVDITNGGTSDLLKVEYVLCEGASTQLLTALKYLAVLAKSRSNEGETLISPTQLIRFDNMLAVMMLPNLPIIYPPDESEYNTSLGEALALSHPEYTSLPRITEEEFYNNSK